MPTRVKICGITREEDAKLAVELGAAALGFNFYKSSPRYLEPHHAQAIIVKLPPFVTAVGVFADEAEDRNVARIVEESGVTVLQLHGPRFPRMDGVLAGFPWIRGVAVREGFTPQDLRNLGTRAILLDAYDAKLQGGTGKTFNWPLARDAGRYATIILAGGLTAQNVGKGISEVRPYAVDVASGVESAPGVKDPEKLKGFFREVQKADQGIENGN
jgi:phosphoribosylanthranilate isomerase